MTGREHRDGSACTVDHPVIPSPACQRCRTHGHVRATVTYVVTFDNGRIGRTHDNPPQKFAIIPGPDAGDTLAAAVLDYAVRYLASRDVRTELDLPDRDDTVGFGAVYAGMHVGARFTIRVAPHRAEKGDIFDDGHGNIARVFRASKDPDRPWVDIVVVQPNEATWSKRMPAGIPSSWTRAPRR